MSSVFCYVRILEDDPYVSISGFVVFLQSAVFSLRFSSEGGGRRIGEGGGFTKRPMVEATGAGPDSWVSWRRIFRDGGPFCSDSYVLLIR